MSDQLLFWPILDRAQNDNIRRVGFAFFLFLALILFASPTSLFAQAPPAFARRFPSEGYYSSLALISEGRVREAQHGFETAYRAARQAGDEHGIDSVPILIRTGQSIYLQGNIAEGLEQIESGLLLAKRCRSWTRLLQPLPWPMRGLSNDIRGIQWYDSQRNTDPGAFPDLWPIAMGSGVVIVEMLQGETTPTVDIVRIDAIEVYLAQAMGLRLRYQMLGKLASELPLSREILEAYPALRAEHPEVLQRCNNICRAMAMIATGDSKEAKKLIQANLEVQGGWDHPMTGVGLLVLADLAMQDDDRLTAIRMLCESTLVFARLGQHDWLADAAERLGAVATVRRQQSVLNVLVEMATWVRTRSYLSHASLSAAIAMLAAELENYPLSESNAAHVLRASSKNVGPLPHSQATARFARARVLLKQGKSEPGLTGLELSLALSRGVELPGPLSRPLFQLRLLGNLVDAGQIKPDAALKQYDQLLDGPIPQQWQYEPWESLGASTADPSEHALKWLRLVERQGNKETTIQAIDRLLRLRCRFHLPMAGRELDLRILFHSDSSALPHDLQPGLGTLRKQFPAIDQAANVIHRQIEAARKVTSIDAKDWSLEEKNLWNQLASQCDLQEQRLVEASTSRTAVPALFPPAANVSEVRKKLNGDANARQAVLGFFVASQSVYGYFLSAEQVEFWNVERSILANEKFHQLADAIGVAQSPSKVLASLKKPVWEKLAKELHSLLIPSNVQTQLADVNHLTIIPDGWLWYVPFESLPAPYSNSATPWLAKCAISYEPTLGIAIHRKSEPIELKRKLGIVRSGFFVPDKDVDRALTNEVVQSIPGTNLLEVPTKVHPSRWSRLQFDQVWVAIDTKLEMQNPFAMMGYDAGGNTSMRQWLQLPMVAPKQLVLAGCEVPAMSRRDGDGLELFRLACGLAATGNQAALINRWSSHGESSQLLLKSFLEASDSLPVAKAWRRSVLSLWETPLRYLTEPVLGSLKKDYFQEEFTGTHPIFWAGTMVIGNSIGFENH